MSHNKDHLELLLFGAYLLLFCWLVTKMKFFTQSGLTKSQLIILFLLKVIAGIFYGWTGVYYGNMAQLIDTWMFHYQGLQQLELLKHHPLAFFTDLFQQYPYDSYTRFLSSKNSWWNDLKANFVIKLFGIFDLFSFGQYYVNVVFYNFLTLFGPIALFRVMKDSYPHRVLPLLVGIFLVPSFLYWTSGLHKEGLLVDGLGLVIYSVFCWLKYKRSGLKYGVLFITGFLLILILRNFLLFTLFAGVVAWIVSSRLKRFRPVYTYTFLYLFFFAIFFFSTYVSQSLDLPNAVVTKQQEFLSLRGGNSAVEVTSLQPTVKSFIGNLPQAFSLSTLRPFPSDVHHLLSLAAAIEVSFLVFLFFLFLVFKKGYGRSSPFFLFCIFFSLTVLLMIGYTVNILGAIVRYRSIVLPLLVAPLMAQIDWKRLYGVVFNIIKTDNV